MQSDFENFIACWYKLATRSGAFILPPRSAITVSEFHTFLPNMMIARWDQGFTVSHILYVGTGVDKAFQRDIRVSPLKVLFADKTHVMTHQEIARTVVRRQVGAQVHAHLSVGGTQEVKVSQLRLPLAPENGEPLILSLFNCPDFEPSAAKTEMPVISDLKHQFFELLPEMPKAVGQ